MASTAHKTTAEYKEHFDEPDVFNKKIDMLATWIKESKHFTSFTGAGISTSTGIPDFRSGLNTVLETGAGAWTLKAAKQGRSAKSKTKSSLKAIPSPTHMALVQLQKLGYLKHLISQNTDGLHRRSGFPPQHISELHGNTNLESCEKCGKEYLRDFRTRTARQVHDHRTGRFCEVPGCRGPLKDSIINFGENLPEKALNDGFAHSYKSDICLAMGSSLRVTPAADMPEVCADDPKKKLVIVNLQSTPLDDGASLRINGKCDDVMNALMAKLGIEIPGFKLLRRVQVLKKTKKGNPMLDISGVDSDGTPVSLFKKVSLYCGEEKPERLAEEPFTFEVPEDSDGKEVKIKLQFMGHYNEPALTFHHLIMEEEGGDKQIYQLAYNPFDGKWDPPVPLYPTDGDEVEDLAKKIDSMEISSE